MSRLWNNQIIQLDAGRVHSFNNIFIYFLKQMEKLKLLTRLMRETGDVNYTILK